MGALFGKSKKTETRVTEQDKAILQLKQQRDKLRQYQKRIEQSLEKDRELAKKCLQTGRKERAKLLLRKKKYQEKMLGNADIQLENLEKLAADIEFAQIEQRVLNGLKVGNEALKMVNKVMSIDEIELILAETQEGVEKQKEISDMLSGVLDENDEDAVLNELDELIANERKENEKADENVLDKLPEVPSDSIAAADDDSVSKILPEVPADEETPSGNKKHKKDVKDDLKSKILLEA